MGIRIRRWVAALLGALVLAGCVPVAAPTPSPTVPAASPSPTASPTPSEAPVPRLISYDHYLIPKVADQVLDDLQRAYYRRLVDAVLAREESFPIPEGVREHDESWRAGALFSQLNPLGGLVMTGFAPDGKNMSMSYYFDEADHERMVQSIAPRIEQLVADLIPQQANEVDAVFAVYQHLATTTSYTQDGPLTGSYGVLIDSSGMCVGFATGMTWLLAQAGMDISYPVEWTPKDPEVAGHAWAIALLDGQHYHFDPTWDNGESGGLQLRYFGMTEAERLSGPVGPFGYTLLDDVVPAPSATDERFAPLREAVAYKRDPVRHRVLLRQADGTVSVFSTETLTITQR